MMSSKSTAGVLAWRGPSELTGDEIAVVLTGIASPSQNSKTGPMVQAYIIPATVHAGRAVGTDAERAVCGDCPLRGSGFGRADRMCYVAWGVWVVGTHMERGAFRESDTHEAGEMLKGKQLRIGAYGDPAAVPISVWDALLRHTAGWTGYTHQWRDCDPEFKKLLMASCETEQDMLQANAAGWRTFRIRWKGGKTIGREIVCPAESHNLTCDKCRLCRGTATGAKNIVITAHGSGAAKYSERYRQVHLPLMDTRQPHRG